MLSSRAKSRALSDLTGQLPGAPEQPGRALAPPAGLKPGQNLLHYRVGEKLGEGGMGEVYAAADQKLDRRVALKILSPEMAGAGEWLQRFRREAKAVAALSHPNIVTLYSVEEADGLHFLAMELVKGTSLDRRIGGRGMPLEEILGLAIPIADALAAAHEEGVVHRDLKPGNVMVTEDEQVKVLDFGLAKLAHGSATEGASRASTESLLTREGRVLGTFPYMSPEQIQGKAVDACCDIFSFGVMLYEMATGQRPFQGETSVAIISSVLRDTPIPVTELNQEVPARLERIVEHCLEKNPRRRWRSARDLATELRDLKREASGEVAVGAAARRRPSRRRPSRVILAAAAALLVATITVTGWWWSEREATPAAPSLVANRMVVAEFDNRAGDPALNHLGRTIAEVLTQGLSEVPGVEILPPRSLSPAAAEDRGDPIRRLAEETGASLVVTGAYSPHEEGLRLQARVMSAEKMQLIYGIDEISASRGFPDEALEEVRQRITGLAATLYLATNLYRCSVEEWSLCYSEPPRYNAFLQFATALEYFGKDYAKFFQLNQQAIDLDPEFFWAQYLMATAHGNVGQRAEAEAIALRWEAKRHQLAVRDRFYLDQTRAWIDGRNAEALQSMLDLGRFLPKDPTRTLLVGFWALCVNRPDLTVETYSRWESSPGTRLTVRPLWRYGVWCAAHHLLGNYEEELSLSRLAEEEYPQALYLRAGQVRALAALGKLDELDRLLEEAMAIPAREGDAGLLVRIAARELRAHGRREDALRFAELAVDWSRGRPAGEAATVYARWGLGSALVLAERWQEARAVFVVLAEEEPEEVEFLGFLGVLAARLGERDQALGISRRLAAWEHPYVQGDNTYWRASIAAALGDRDDAVRHLRNAFAEGLHFWSNDENARHNDMNLEPLRGYPTFDQLIRPQG